MHKIGRDPKDIEIMTGCPEALPGSGHDALEVIKEKQKQGIQKEVINSLDKSLSGSLLEEIQTNDMTLQEYGMKMSLLHKEHMDSLATNDEYFFTTTSQDSLEAAKKIEESNQEKFEDYLKDFLNKIS